MGAKNGPAVQGNPAGALSSACKLVGRSRPKDRRPPHPRGSFHRFSHFLAKFQGKPAGLAQIRYHSGYAFIPGGRPEVKPEFTNKGVFSTLVAHLAADAVKRGLHVIATYAGKQTSPLWLQLGFEKTCEYELYFWRPN